MICSSETQILIYLYHNKKTDLNWQTSCHREAFAWMCIYKFSLFLNGDINMGTLNLLPDVSKVQHHLHIQKPMTFLQLEMCLPIQKKNVISIATSNWNSCSFPGQSTVEITNMN